MAGGVRNMFEQLPDSSEDDESWTINKKQTQAAKKRQKQRNGTSNASGDNNQSHETDVPAAQEVAQGRLASATPASKHLQHSAAGR